MYIDKIFSNYEDNENLYSVILDDEEVALFSEIQREFGDVYSNGMTKYDRTDRYKKMKDSDILAEKKRSNTGSYLDAAKVGAIGAAAGAGLAAGYHGLNKVGWLPKALRSSSGTSFLKRAGIGAGLGAALAGGAALIKGHKLREDNRWHNQRLDYMQKQARRRELRDWDNNANNREGYTY